MHENHDPELSVARSAGEPGEGLVAAHHAADAARIGRPTRAGLFYVACSRDYAEEPCGCPIRQAAAHRCDDPGEDDAAADLDDDVRVASY